MKYKLFRFNILSVQTVCITNRIFKKIIFKLNIINSFGNLTQTKQDETSTKRIPMWSKYVNRQNTFFYIKNRIYDLIEVVLI